jgi:tetratricopeptide (TPR) repeat protein
MVDDPYVVYSNLFIRGFSWANIRYVWTHFDPELYMPLTFMSYQFNYLLAGLSPGFYHCTNIVLHSLNAALIAWIFFLLTKRPWASCAAALIFAVHPLNTEAVVWIAARKDVLSTFFFLLSLGFYLTYRKSESKKLYWISVVAFLFALLSKVSVLTLPAILLLFDVMIEKRRGRGLVLDTIPYAGLSLLFAIIAMFGKTRIVGSSTFMETLLMACKSSVFYIQKFFVPLNLTTFYPYQKIISISSPDFYVPLIIVLLLIVLIVVSFRRFPWISAGLLFFFITLSPTFLNFHKGDITFFAVDRYAYVPMIGLLFIVMQSLCTFCERGYRNRLRFVPIILATVVLITFSVLSLKQSAVWADDETMLNHALVLYPESIPARISLSVLYRETGRATEEKRILTEGAAHQPYIGYDLGLGSIAAREGDTTKAEMFYKAAEIKEPKNPEPSFYLASLREQQGKTDEAILLYKKAIALDGSYVSAYNNLGGIYNDAGNLAEAEAMFRKALEQNPSFMEAQYNLFQTLELEHKNAEALPHLESAYLLSPENRDIVMALAYRLGSTGNKARAVRILSGYLADHADDHAVQRLLDSLSAR